MSTTIPRLISAAEGGDTIAAEELFGVLYSELHRLARHELARHSPSLGISPTTLLHEAYLDLAAQTGSVFPDRPRFMSYAARVMRSLVIDYVRNRSAYKRGGQFQFTFEAYDLPGDAPAHGQLVDISRALDELAKTDAAGAEVVDLKFFCGFSFAEIAALRGVSERTVQRSWERARIYLHRRLSGEPL
jgi:RNA polymerase sigma factor (TIGR02999 family)